MKYINTNKLNNLKINKDNVYIVMDFDKTLTSKNSSDSWMATANADVLGKECAMEWKQLNLIYEQFEQDYSLDFKLKNQYMVEWYGKSIQILYKYNLTKSKLLQSMAKEKIEFRNGAKEFLEKLNDWNVPIIILSAGIGNVIEEFLKKEGCYLDNIFIISNFIQFDENGDAKEFDISKIIHSLNKSLEGKLPKEQIDKISKRKYKILIGDIKEDENMINENQWPTTLKVGILNNVTPNLLKIYKTTFDVVLTDEQACFQEILKFFNIQQ